MDKLRISTVNYLNSTPFIYGLRLPEFASLLDVSLDYPAESARKLVADEVDISLIPIGALSELKEYHIISDFCIGAKGKVNTVKIFSEVPLEKVDSIILDYQSRTSVLLARILVDQFWKLKVNFVKGYESYEKEIFGKTAGLVIGDRAIGLLGKFKYEYDLSEAWYKWQNRPFVFAAWVANKPIPSEYVKMLNISFQRGIDQIEFIVEKYQHLNSPHFSVHQYLSKDISYELDADKKQSMCTFISMVKDLSI